MLIGLEGAICQFFKCFSQALMQFKGDNDIVGIEDFKQALPNHLELRKPLTPFIASQGVHKMENEEH